MFREKLSHFFMVFDDNNELVAIEPICIGKIGTPACMDAQARTDHFICSKRQKMACQCAVIAATLCH